MTQKKANMPVVIAAMIGAFAIMGFAAYTFSSQQREKIAIDEWVNTYPVNAMVITKHPNTYPLFVRHFAPYYAKAGQAGIERGQMELQQIFNVNYLIDYIWTVKDPELREFIGKLLALVDRLVKVQGGQPGLCEKYFGNSAYFEQADAAAGGRYFIEYMLASEKLFLSAEDAVTYKITPEHPNYQLARQAANREFWTKFRQLHPSLNHSQLQQAADLFDPLRSCAGYAEYLRALYAMETGFMSLHWRVAMEADRPRFEVMRRQRGSE